MTIQKDLLERNNTSNLQRLQFHNIDGILHVTQSGDRNWEAGMKFSLFLDSAIRHSFQYLGGARDEDHLGHAVFNLLAVMEFEERIANGTASEELNNLPKP